MKWLNMFVKRIKRRTKSLALPSLCGVIPLGLVALWLRGVISFERDTYLWMFSTAAQSMAALFALAGAFTVFRFEETQRRIIDLVSSFKEKLRFGEWRDFFGPVDVSQWDEGSTLQHAKKLLEVKKNESNHIAYNNLEVEVLVLESLVKFKHNIKSFAKSPLAFIMGALGLSLICIPLVDILHKKQFVGVLALAVLLALCLFGLVKLFEYFLLSFPGK